MIKVLHRVVHQMVIVLPRDGLANDSSILGILGYYIRNIISIDLTKNSDFCHLVKSHFCGRGDCQYDYIFT